MNRMKRWRWVRAAVLLAMGGTAARADDLRITSFGNDADLVFVTADSSSSQHNYRVESTTSLVSTAWTTIRTVGGVAAGAAVTNGVTASGAAAFYRIVATSNSVVFVDGAYMAVDISGGTEATNYPVSYYGTLADVPDGANSDAYKTTKILMRLIPGGTFIMGSPVGELGRDSSEERHQVRLSQDFYLGVFEVTQRQWELVMGNKPSYFENATYYATRPVEQVSYYDIRENPAGWGSDDPEVDWPHNSTVNTNSFMGKLRAKTRRTGFDLPTESQWEYACRAGTTTALNSGYNLASTGQDAQIDVVGRYWYNGGSDYNWWGGNSWEVAPSVGTAVVGSYLANAWGLYDMHGNVWEWCLDWIGTYPGTATDPKGGSPSEGDLVSRGSGWANGASYCRSASRARGSPDGRGLDSGFRVCCSSPGQP